MKTEITNRMNYVEGRLRELVLRGAGKRWDDYEMAMFAARRLDFESSMIGDGAWTDCFLMVAEMVEAARKAGGVVARAAGGQLPARYFMRLALKV